MATKKRIAKKRIAKKKTGLTAFDFCRAFLKKERKASFAQIRDAAAKKGLKLAPISYGRSQALEGIVKARPAGTAKKNLKARKRGPGRPRGSKNRKASVGSVRSTGVDSIDRLIGTVQTLQRERDDAVEAVAKIRDLLKAL